MSDKFAVGDKVRCIKAHNLFSTQHRGVVKALFPNEHMMNVDGESTYKSHWVLDDSKQPAKLTDVAATLAERGNRYGEFDEHARITQNIKRAMQDSNNWKTLPDDMKESLEMTAHKIGRILNGDPDYKDSWHDIIGYTKLVEERLED